MATIINKRANVKDENKNAQRNFRRVISRGMLAIPRTARKGTINKKPFCSQRTSKYIAYIPGVGSPVCTKLKLHDNAGRHAYSKGQRKNFDPKPR